MQRVFLGRARRTKAARLRHLASQLRLTLPRCAFLPSYWTIGSSSFPAIDFTDDDLLRDADEQSLLGPVFCKNRSAVFVYLPRYRR